MNFFNMPQSSQDARGAALVEYGILVGLIAVLAIGSVIGLGNRVEKTFDTAARVLASELAETSATSVEAAVDAGPVGPDFSQAFVLWTMTSAPRPSNVTHIGYGEAQFGPFGSITIETGTNAPVFIASQTSSGHLALLIDGNIQNLALTHKLVCNNGEWLLSDTDLRDYNSSGNFTRFFWYDEPQIFFDGETNRCGITPV